MKIFLTGASGFIGKNFISYFDNKFSVDTYKRGSNFEINHEVVVHLAGKAHDLKNTSMDSEYYEVNTNLTKKIYKEFLGSKAKVFILLSSVKAVADSVDGILTEDLTPSPETHYGKSKLLAEQYILSQHLSDSKRFFILRPCMVHGPHNRGNLNLLYKLISKNIPWILGSYENKRSYCSIENLLFIIYEIIHNDNIKSGIYNVADDIPISTNELISIIAKSQNKKAKIFKISKNIIKCIAKIGDIFKLPLNTVSLNKLTNSYVVSNHKILNHIGKPLPISSKNGLIKTFDYFNSNE